MQNYTPLLRLLCALQFLTCFNPVYLAGQNDHHQFYAVSFFVLLLV